jgi:murein DD-endopeptidase MepM/ murein hydrolase activator NlpD
MVHPSQQQQPYPRRKPPSSIAITRNGRVRTFRVRPVLAALVLGCCGLLLTAYIGATAYLIYRDDLLGAALARQVAMQYAYEDRIAALRSELDRVSSRHLIQTESVETQLGALLARQADIRERQAALDSLIERAQIAGVSVAAPEDGNADASGPAAAPLAYADEPSAVDHMITGTLLKGEPGRGVEAAEQNLRPLLANVRSELEIADRRQAEALEALGGAAEAETERLGEALVPIGIEVGGPVEPEPEGGPFIPAGGLHFVERAAILERSLEGIETIRRRAEGIPIYAPVRTGRISSRFGNRMDPFLRRPAFHAGLDFVAPEGAEVRATAPGTITAARWQGGYGAMVEIRHDDGFATRYGHLSAVFVSPGARVAAGTLIGRVGSTGRSTGPHLHYEIRRTGEPVNPTPYLAAGRALRHAL